MPSPRPISVRNSQARRTASHSCEPASSLARNVRCERRIRPGLDAMTYAACFPDAAVEAIARARNAIPERPSSSHACAVSPSTWTTSP